MAEYDYDNYDSTQTQAAQPAKRGVDVITLIVGIATLLVSGYVLSDGSTWLPQFDFRWIMAGGAIFVGVLLLAASLRKSRR
ncbi:MULTISPECIES: hypothetical protein [Amycolatopsis]|uniref:Putative membrane protein n=1 Tax=Amycolatopsis japonica TaxID=208439 RepID=A0A075V677_9PSEU|nr:MULTISPECIES: hypothetical protein [Amycolatopsis]AIG79966.1 Putative membrane protein [Amycolatopsis japonica]OKJ94000.1 hypothetical protein AMK34_27715 [Amycolatopsis sp. CB00013]